MNKRGMKNAAALTLIAGLVLTSGGQALAGGPNGINAGLDYAHVTMSDGTIWSFGNSTNYKLGSYNHGSKGAVTAPVMANDVTDFVNVDAGYNHSVALGADKSVWTWGLNNYGQTGISGTGSVLLQPAKVPSLSNIVDVASGEDHSLALDANGTLYGFGANYNGQLGNGNAINTTTPVSPLLSGIKDASAGKRYSVVVRTDGNVWAWGNNTYMQGGRVGYNSTRPNQVLGISGVNAVEAGSTHVVALKADGTVWFWGTDLPGAAESTASATPLQIQGITGAVAIAAGNGHSLILKSDGTVWSFGSNTSGQLGNPTAGYTGLTAVQVQDLTGVTKISAGGNTSYALKSDGSLWTWGANSSGQFGNGTTTPSQVPVKNQNITSTLDIQAVPYYWQLTLNYGAPHLPVAKYKIHHPNSTFIMYEGPNTTWTHKNLKNDWNYSYVVEAYDAAGNLIAIGNINTKTLNGDMNSNVTLDGYNNATITWSMLTPGPVAKYKVIHVPNKVLYQGTDTSFTATGLKPGATHILDVQAFDANGVKIGDGGGNVTTPEEPATATASATASTATITIDSAVTASKYVLTVDSKVVYQGTDKTITLNGLLPGREYYIYYDIYNTNNQWVTSNSVSVTTQTMQIGYSATDITHESLRLNYAPTNYDLVTKYEVRRNGVVVYSGPDAFFIDSGLQPSTSYTYKFDYYKADHPYSLGSLTRTVTTSAAPVIEPAPEPATEPVE